MLVASKNDVRKTWNIINKVLDRNSKSKCNVKAFNDNGISVTGDKNKNFW